MIYEYIDKNREGDHICYISSLTRFKRHYPKWEISKSLDDIFREISEAWKARLAARRHKIMTGKRLHTSKLSRSETVPRSVPTESRPDW
jgi:hypothetical protein